MLLFATLAIGVTIDDTWSTGPITATVLLVSVVLHEAAHCIAAIRLGGVVDEVVLAPIGGLRSPRVPNEPEPQLFVALVGPMVNLGLVILGVFSLVVQQVPTDKLLPLLNPVSPTGMLDGPLAVIALKQIVWINWTLFLLNLLPAYPFDGGPALRAALWPLLGRRSAAVATAYCGQAIAVGLCVLAVTVEKGEPQAEMPLWAPLVMLAVFLFFSTRRDLALADQHDVLSTPTLPYPDASSGDLLDVDWSSDDYDKVLVEHSADAKTERRLRKIEADEAYEDARVDDILARLHTRGFDQLSEEDRAILQRASQRYRHRRHEG